jgi:hypothetical protein
MFNRNNFTFKLVVSSQFTWKDKEVDAAATSAGHLAVDQCQEQELPLLVVVGPFDEDVVAVSWNWDQKVRPPQTDHDQVEVNNGEGLHMKSLLELH